MASVDVVVVERGGKHGAISGERGDYFHHAQEEWLVTSHCSDDDEKPAEKVSLHCNAQGSVVQVFFITCVRILPFQITQVRNTTARVVRKQILDQSAGGYKCSYVGQFWLLQDVKLLDNRATLL